jgi:ketosteroid isomerase-like protein
MSQENLEVVRRSNELYRLGELETMLDEFIDPDVEWETRWPGLPPVFHGREGVRQWIALATEPMEIEMTLIDAVEVDEDTVLAEFSLRGRGRESGVPADMKVFDLYSIRNRMVYRRRTFYSREEALEAAGRRE